MPSADSLRIPASLQALTPTQARFCLAAARFLKQDLGLDLRGSSLLVGLSGGADSLALLLVLHYLTPSLHLRLAAAHLDHGLRPSSSQEADFCRAFCQKLGIACLSERQDIAGQRQQNKTGIEEEGRAARYGFFAETAARIGSDWIVTGHQNDDLAEDLLMRLIRGAGWPALSGMPAVDRERRLLRPLLLTPRKDIEDFLASLGLTWLRDESNDDRAHLRNRVRMDLMPLILRENPAFLTNVAGLWKLGRIDEELFDTLLPSFDPDPDAESSSERERAPAAMPAPNVASPPVPAPDGEPAAASDAAPAIAMRRERLESLPKALRLRFYKKTLSHLGPGQPLLAGLLALDRAWLAGGERTSHRFPGGKTAVVDKKSIVWRKK